MARDKQARKPVSPRWRAIQFLAAIILAMWAVFGLQSLFGLDFSKYGILPRNEKGLIGIVLAPFIHSNIEHIAYNTVAFVLIALVLALSYPRKFIWVFLVSMISTDLLVWLFARSAYHVGISGVIFALVGFMIAYGIARRSVGAIILSVVIGIVYGSFLYGVIPSAKWISWESHLFGLISGILWGIVWGVSDRRRSLKAQAQIQEQPQQSE